jgi:NAD-dependent dihydropyrimidine dehydrogenase PreA subunit
MADFYEGKVLSADCFACGACIEACPEEHALGWWTKA